MPGGYHHLAYDQRCQLYALKKRGDSAEVIAQELGVHRSTIYREIKRNSGLKGYRYKQANEKASQRRLKANTQPQKMTQETVATVEEKLKMQWSPTQISGWLKKTNLEAAVSHETYMLTLPRP